MEVAATAGNAAVSVTWLAPADDGGSPILGYEILGSPGNISLSVVSGTSAVVPQLADGTTYTFTVTARNAVGLGPASAPSNGATPLDVPGTATQVIATAGDSQAAVTWTAPAAIAGASILSYTVTTNPGGRLVTTQSPSALIEGLSNGSSYTFTVVANGVTGSGLPSAPSNPVVPASAPSAPTNLAVTAADGRATVSWIAPAWDGGSPVLSYTVTANPGGLTATTPAMQAVVPGLTDGVSYTFTVHATNAIGNSAESAMSAAVIPQGVPSAPTQVVATAGNGQATVSWAPPVGLGFGTILSYLVTALPGGATMTTPDGSTTSVTFTGLTNGSAYTFTVQAADTLGLGVASAPSNAVTPATVPGAPTTVVAVAGDGQATVSWVAPASNGGAPVTGYIITTTPGGATLQTTAVASAVVYGLSDGTFYTFTVQAINAAGTGVASLASAAVSPEPAQNEPSAPQQVTAILAGVASATVSWQAPLSNGGLVLTNYSVTPVAGSVVGAAVLVDGATLTASVSGLTKGTTYTFQVVATNSASSSPAAVSNSISTPDLPGVPIGVTATRGNGQAVVSWQAPLTDGGSSISGYTVTTSPAGPASVSVSATLTQATVTGLADGMAYTFTVHATNAVGNSAESAPSNAITPAGVPGAPTGVTAVDAGSGTVTLTWVAPVTTGGSPVLRYTATALPGGASVSTATGQATSVTMGGLINGTAYTFTVHATNAVGSGPESTPTGAVTPATIPGAPTGVHATAGDSIATVTWTAPAQNGGAAIISYTVTPSPTGLPVTVEGATTATISGLLDGTSYTFTVHATNGAGNGPESAPSNAVTPLTTPGVPLDVTAFVGVGQATLSWYAPASNGGTAITGYSVAVYEGATLASMLTVGGTTTQTVVMALSYGSSYSFQVQATNAVGSGPAAISNAVTVPNVPGAPTSLYLMEINNEIVATWSAPTSDNGSAITGYTALITPGGTPEALSAAASTYTFAGITNGTSYLVSITATNAVGAGPAATGTGVAGMLPDGGPSGGTDGGTGSTDGGTGWDGGYQPVSVSAAVAKVKNLLVGLPPLESEVASITADQTALGGLIDTWIATPQFTSKMMEFFEQSFQQSEINAADFSNQFEGQFPVANTAGMIENFQQSFARTALQIIASNKPFNTTMNTTQYMMTPALMSAYAYLDAVNVNDSGTVVDLFSKANPTQVLTIESTTPVALSDSLNAAGPNYLTFYQPNIATSYDPLCPYGTITYKAPISNAIMSYVMRNEPVDFDVSPNNHTCYPPAIPTANQIVQPSDYTTWQWITVRQPMPGESTTRFFDLASMRAGNPLVLNMPAVGFFTTPAFLAGWNTNASNLARVTLNQTMIVSLGEPIDLTNTTAPQSLAALDSVHAAPGSTCYGCHQSLDPMRQFFRQAYSLNYTSQTSTTETALPGQFAFHGVSVAGTTIFDLGTQLAAHPMFAAAWVQKLCTWANSAPCDATDPVFMQIVSNFVSSNFNWNTMVHDLFSSPLVTYLQDTATVDAGGETFSIARQAQVCALLSNRLNITDICGLDVNTVVPNYLKPVQTIAAVLPSDAYSRGNATPVLADNPSLFLRTGMENLCAAVAQQVIDNGSTSLYSSATTTSQQAAIQAFVTNLMGLTSDRSAQPLAILQSHFTAAQQTGATNSASLQSTFVLACLSPYVIGVGQ